MPIIVDQIDTVHDLLQAVKASFAADRQAAPAELQQVLEQDKIKPLWQAIWNNPENLNYAQDILKLPCTPEVMIDIIPTLDQISRLEQQDLLRNYFLATQRFDICLSYLMKKETHEYRNSDLRKFTEPFLSALLTGQLSDESVNHLAQFICGNSGQYRYLALKYIFNHFGMEYLYESAIYRTMMRNEQFARNMRNMIIETGIEPPMRQIETTGEVSRMWTAVYSHERLRVTTPMFAADQRSASTYYDAYGVYLDPRVADQLLQKGDRRSIKTLLKIAPEKLEAVLEDQQVLQPVGGGTMQELLKELMLKKPKLKQALLEQQGKRPYVETTNRKIPLTWWQQALRVTATVLSIFSLGLFNTLVWLVVSSVTRSTSTIPLDPTEYFNKRPFAKDITLPYVEYPSYNKDSGLETELLTDIYVLAKQKNIPLSKEWNALLNSYIAHNSNAISKRKQLYVIHALEDACLHVEKTGEVPANFMQRLAAVTLGLHGNLGNHGRNSVISISDQADPTVDVAYLGYLNRWLHQLQTKYPDLRVLQEAQNSVNELINEHGSPYYKRLFEPTSYLLPTMLDAHPELALWTPIQDAAASALSRARLLVDTNVDHGAHLEDEVYNLLAFTATAGTDVQPIAVPQPQEPVQTAAQAQPQVQQPEEQQPKSATNLARLFAIRQNGLIVNALASSFEAARAKAEAIKQTERNGESSAPAAPSK